MEKNAAIMIRLHVNFHDRLVEHRFKCDNLPYNHVANAVGAKKNYFFCLNRITLIHISHQSVSVFLMTFSTISP